MIPQISWIIKGTLHLISTISSTAWAFWFCYNAHVTETQTLKETFHATASPQRRFRGGVLVHKLWNSWKLKPRLCDTLGTEKSCALPCSAASVGQTLAGFLSSVHSDDYVSDLRLSSVRSTSKNSACHCWFLISENTTMQRNAGLLHQQHGASVCSLLSHATVETDTFYMHTRSSAATTRLLF